jgi:hemolysin III
VASGLLYAAGAACFVRKAPNPKPTVFGYHEIWHLFTLLGGACEFLVMLDLLA